LLERKFRLAIIVADIACEENLGPALSLAALYGGRAWPDIGDVDVVVGLRADGASGIGGQRGSPVAMPRHVAVRTFVWRAMEAAAARLVFPPDQVPAGDDAVIAPDDGGREFRDADAWIFMASPTYGRVPWLRPTAVYCAALDARRADGTAPGDMRPGDRAYLIEAMIGWRRAHCAFTTDAATHADLVDYAGIHPDRTLLLPPSESLSGNDVGVAYAALLARLAGGG
jgi:hypothetical protein